MKSWLPTASWSLLRSRAGPPDQATIRFTASKQHVAMREGVVSMLLSAAIDEFLTVHVKNLARETQRGYTWQLERFVTYCTSSGILDTDDVRAVTVARFLDLLRSQPTARGGQLSSRSLR